MYKLEACLYPGVFNRYVFFCLQIDGPLNGGPINGEGGGGVNQQFTVSKTRSTVSNNIQKRVEETSHSFIFNHFTAF